MVIETPRAANVSLRQLRYISFKQLMVIETDHGRIRHAGC